MNSLTAITPLLHVHYLFVTFQIIEYEFDHFKGEQSWIIMNKSARAYPKGESPKFLDG
jgi:hypothetical protein